MYFILRIFLASELFTYVRITAVPSVCKYWVLKCKFVDVSMYLLKVGKQTQYY